MSRSSVVDPTLRQRWRTWRFPITMSAVIVVFAIGLTLLQDQTSRGYLDPDGVNASGARALARLLEEQGVTVTALRTTDDVVNETEAGDTILVTEPDLLFQVQIDRLTGLGADLVLVAPTTVDRYAPDLGPAGGAPEQVLPPECDLPAAERAGEALVGGQLYGGSGDATLCYSRADAGALAVGTSADGGRVIALGSAAPLTNRYLDEDGNAALALGLLGENERLTWYRPVAEPPQEAEEDVLDLVPGWVIPALWQLAIAAVLAAWWRARRLGRVVTEPLPVVVRAAEAAEGRARLYRRGGARGHAAAILRDATARRLRSRLGLPASAPVSAVVDAVTARTSQDAADVTALLAGPDPTDDAGMVRLAGALDELEQEVIAS